MAGFALGALEAVLGVLEAVVGALLGAELTGGLAGTPALALGTPVPADG